MHLKRIRDWILDCVFPVSCIACNAPKHTMTNPDGFVCSACLANISSHQWLFCPVCNTKLAGFAQCPTHRGPMRFLGVASSYQNNLLKHLIWRYKYEFCEPLARPLGAMLAEYFIKICKPYCDAHAPEWIITTIPLSHKRMRWRGFNQGALLAQEASQRVNIPYAPMLSRMHFRKPQMELATKTEREQNIRGAFAVRRDCAIQHKRIIIVDDIATSGATLAEASRMLKLAGAKEIIGLVLARNNSA